MYLLLAIILLPIIEIAVFIKVGSLIGVWPTIALVLLTAFAGTALLRSQGFAVLHRAQAQLARGELPVGAVLDGVCLLIAGVLLLTPGFTTDVMGLLLFIPPVRRWLGRHALERMMRGGNVQVFTNVPGMRPRDPHSRPHPGQDGVQDGVLEGEWTEVDPDDAPAEPPADGTSKWRPPHSRPHPRLGR